MGRSPIGKVAMTGAERARRYQLQHPAPRRERITLTEPAKVIADKLLAMSDQDKLRKVIAMVAAQIKKRGTA